MSTSKDKPYHHGDLRGALLRAAQDMLDEGGPAAVGLREAARRAGVSPTAPYRHFADKDALLAAVATEGFAALGAALREAAQPEAGRINRMGHAYVRFALANPGLFRLMFGQSATQLGRDPALTAAAKATFAALGGVVGSEATSPIRDAMAARAPAIRAWAFVHGLAYLLLDGMLPASESEAWIELFFSAPYPTP